VDPVVSHLAAALVPLALALAAYLRAHTKRHREMTGVMHDVRNELRDCVKDRAAQRDELSGLRADIAAGRCPVCAQRARAEDATPAGGIRTKKESLPR